MSEEERMSASEDTIAQPVPAEEPTRSRRTWDFLLMMLTVGLLGSLGVQSFVGTLYAWRASRGNAGWDQTAAYGRYIGVMNAIAAPQLVALVVVMGLCVPKRLLSRRTLVAVSAGMLAIGEAVYVLTGDLATGLAVYLGISGLIQVAVVVLTLAGARGLAFMSEARLAKVGSGLLHLGFIVTAFVVVALQDSPLMLPTFFVAIALTVVGTALSFRARRVGALPE